ncbi:hypothetical protein AYK24_08260 [Thermoplasmatales archaeon SG8-52-4]|nr:MAG: hypothetical protein AYK24_08260 [Thermoplasmatales archaeon SG8-52-4]
MVENKCDNIEKIWKIFLSRHWKMMALFVVIAALVITSAVYVFLWFVQEAQVNNLVPITLNLWTIGDIVTFLIHLIFWLVIFIIIPVIVIIACIYILWWKKLPDKERKEYRHGHLFGKRSRWTDGGGAVSLFINIVFIIKIYFDGNWDLPISTWKFDYLVYSYLWAIIWILVIFGIPIVIGATWWLRHEMKKSY